MTKSKIKTIVMVIAISLVFVLLIGLCVQFFGQDKIKSSESVKGPDTEHTTSDKNDNSTTDGAVIGESVNKGIMLMSSKIAPTAYAEYGISPQADTAYTITATIEPDYSYYQCATWSIAWVNPNSTWAQGKTVTDYATLSSLGGTYSENSLTTTVECKQAFGEQIKITCVCTTLDSLTAECTVDYVKKVVDIETAGYGYTAFDYYSQQTFRGGIRAKYGSVKDFYGTTETAARRVTAKLIYSDYTIDDTFSITYHREITERAAQVFYNVWGGSYAGAWQMGADVPSYGFGMSPAQIADDYGITGNDYKNHLRYYLVNALATSVELMDYGFEIWTVTATGNYSTFSLSTDFGYTRESIVSNAGSVKLSDSSIKF